MTDQYESIDVLMPRIAKAIGNIAKDRKAEAGSAKYNFRGIDDVLNAIHEHMAENLVTPYPSVVKLERDDRVVKGDLGDRYQSVVTLELGINFHGPNHDFRYASAVAEAQDYGDKAIAKAESVAYRTIMIQTFTIPVVSPETNMDIEVDNDERVPKRKAELNAAVQTNRQSTGTVRHAPAQAGPTDLNETPIAQMKGTELVGALKNAGLPIGGSIEEMRERLVLGLMTGQQAAEPEPERATVPEEPPVACESCGALTDVQRDNKAGGAMHCSGCRTF